jgi:hypothetical protein
MPAGSQDHVAKRRKPGAQKKAEMRGSNPAKRGAVKVRKSRPKRAARVKKIY